MKDTNQLVRDLALAGGHAVERGVGIGFDRAGGVAGLALSALSRRGLDAARLSNVGAAVEALGRASPTASRTAGRLAANAILIGGRVILAAPQLVAAALQVGGASARRRLAALTGRAAP